MHSSASSSTGSRPRRWARISSTSGGLPIASKPSFSVAWTASIAPTEHWRTGRAAPRPGCAITAPDLESGRLPRPAGAHARRATFQSHSARAGRASLGNVTMIAQLANDVGVEQVAALEHILVGAAKTLDLGDMRTVTQAARLRIDPDGVLADDNRAHERRWFECELTYGGVFILRVSSMPKAVRW